MTPEWIGICGFAVLLVLIFLRVPVGIAMLGVGLGGTAILNSPDVALRLMTGQTFAISTLYSLSVLPLFILMGNVASQSGLSRDLYDAAYALVGHLKGGLASATIVGCAGFAALSGSSIASAVTMGQVAYPEMQRRAYGDRLSTGAIAAGGTLGILLPPSTGFVLYAIMTEQSIGRLFMAGILPGILLTTLFVLTVTLIVRFNPDSGGIAPKDLIDTEKTSLLKATPVLGIIVITIGGIYLGLFTPVEAAGIGASLAILMALLRRRLNLAEFIHAIKSTLETTGLCFLILIGAMVFSPFVALSQLPSALSEIVLGYSDSPYTVLTMILVLYLFLGMIIEGLSLMVITLPIVFPVITNLGFDPIWFGVIMVLVLEMGLISPPVGVNCFVVSSVAPNVPLSDIFKGIMPFWAAMICCILLLVAIPEIALFLPNAMF
ncbi:TRAP transporter large permease [Granulosicoccus antarcticus]|uniref:TRAP transporter large permease protein n=1 Tax=Granulosicoccus antarcticus IMCC3135 TaxID=1192854 RepID=A0A2Z2NVK5_9GAMM|nr:TRAP transporter large permease [Granulosicoccus antarcticus]ASJ73758.1 C4-dicarboxylate TRAP transporter large permease protein DctM [Granulosicoccus antarcticus IMCC3135]